MCIIVTEEDLCKKHVEKVKYFVSIPFYPQNSVQPQCRTRSKPNLNIIFVLIIVTDAQVFKTIKKYGGQGYLAAP